MNRRGPLSKLVGEAVNFTKEYRADQKEKKEARDARNSQAGESSQSQSQQYNPTAVQHKDDLSDTEDWALDLDEAQLRQGNSNAVQQRDENVDEDELLRRFVAQHPPPAYEETQNQAHRLPMPVILPQRRPESRHRGFVRAYAPVLEECGIDQETWLQFLDGFEKSIKANPWFGVLNAGVMVVDMAHRATAGFAPLTMLAAFAIHLGLETSRRTYINYKQNGYLDTMNEHFFKPRGLFCLVVKYKPSSTELVEDVDLDHNIVKAVEGRDGQSKWKNAMRASSTTAKNEVEIPDPAPLVFPELDNLEEGQKQNAAKEFGQFVSKYFDRQAAAKFQAEHPDSKIPQAPHQGSASHSDSTPPTSTGGLLSVVSGGRVVGPMGRLQQRRNERRGEMSIERRFGREARKERKKNRPLKKMMKQDALYLMVVNLPTREEMDAVLAQVEGWGN